MPSEGSLLILKKVLQKNAIKVGLHSLLKFTHTQTHTHCIYRETEAQPLPLPTLTAASGGKDRHQEVKADNTFACHLITGCN